MKNVLVTIHGHFYQPPRENPWLETIETEESARPFHDWNERITFECYRPNAHARIVDGKGKILSMINNYSFINFNFGPTLFSWLEEKFPSVYQKIIDADRENLRRFGHGNAIAQVYDHIIMPLANDRDQETEVVWGIADFEKRFHRKPEAIWLPETAVNYSTLCLLAKYGMHYLILSPFQALRTRPFGGKKWTDVSQGRIDPTQPYRCFVKDASGEKNSDQSIDIFFYDGMISKEVAFGDLLKDGNAFCGRFEKAYQPSQKRPQLIHIATDGETYGHHKKFGDMALAYALNEGFHSRGFEIINYSSFLKRFPPVYEVEIDEGPKGEGSSWSCPHGVGRWKEDCGCSTGGKAGWNQKWRKPLRTALDFLKDELVSIFERDGEKVFQDVWEARNGYIEVILNRSSTNLNQFFDRYGLKDLDEEGRIKGLKLLEIQRHALKMYTSCGWFFADLVGLETILILQHAARAIQLAEELTGQEMEGKFLERLSGAKSNLPEMGKGNQIYQTLVKPKSITLDKVVNHFAIFSLSTEREQEEKIFSYRVEKIRYERMERGSHLLVLGQVRVTSEMIPEPKEFIFGMISSTQDIFRTWVSEKLLNFDTLMEKGHASLEKGEEEISKTLTALLGNRMLTVRDVIKEEKQAIFQKLIQRELKEHPQSYAGLYDKTKKTIEALAKEGLEIRLPVEITASDHLLQEFENLRRDFKGVIRKGEIDRIFKETKEYGYDLKMDRPLTILNEILKEKMEVLQKTIIQNLSSLSEKIRIQEEKAQEIIELLDSAKKWGFELSKEEAQNLMEEILDESVEGLEKSWWGNGAAKPFSPNLIELAERLDFNMDQFLKTVGKIKK